MIQTGLNMVVALYSVELSDEGFTCLAFDPGHVQTDMGGGHVSPPYFPIAQVHEADGTLTTPLSTSFCPFHRDDLQTRLSLTIGPSDTPREHQEHDRQDLLGLPGSERQVLRRQG
jgi:hypothetical protein